MKKLISVLLSFSLIFNVIGYGQTCDVSAVEANQANQQCLEQDLCKDPKNISLLAASLTVVASILELLCYLCVGTLCYTWSVLRRFPSSVCELFAGTLSTENEELNKELEKRKEGCSELYSRIFDLEKTRDQLKEDIELLQNTVNKCFNDEKCKAEYQRVERQQYNWEK